MKLIVININLKKVIALLLLLDQSQGLTATKETVYNLDFPAWWTMYSMILFVFFVFFLYICLKCSQAPLVTNVFLHVLWTPFHAKTVTFQAVFLYNYGFSS